MVFWQNRQEVEDGITEMCQWMEHLYQPLLLLAVVDAYIPFVLFPPLAIIRATIFRWIMTRPLRTSIACRQTHSISANVNKNLFAQEIEFEKKHFKIVVSDMGGGIHLWSCTIVKFLNLIYESFQFS